MCRVLQRVRVRSFPVRSIRGFVLGGRCAPVFTWGLGFHYCIHGFGRNSTWLEPARDWFCVVRQGVSFESLVGLSWCECGDPLDARGGSPVCVCVCPCIHVRTYCVSCRGACVCGLLNSLLLQRGVCRWCWLCVPCQCACVRFVCSARATVQGRDRRSVSDFREVCAPVGYP